MRKRAIVEYLVQKSESIQFPHVSFPCHTQPIESITLVEALPNSMWLQVAVNEPISLEQACQVTAPLIPTILDKVAYYYSLQIGAYQLGCVYFELVREDGSTEEVGTTLFGKPTVSEQPIIQTITQPEPELTELLNLAPNPFQDAYYRQFRFAIQSEDAVAQYMFLYSILLQIFDDKQPKVDQFIRSIKPKTPVFKKPVPPYRESIYTKLRNEISHVRPDSTFEQTIEAVRKRLPQLRTLTKIAIEKCILNS